jgi:hypothetical protein
VTVPTVDRETSEVAQKSPPPVAHLFDIHGRDKLRYLLTGRMYIRRGERSLCGVVAEQNSKALLSSSPGRVQLCVVCADLNRRRK